MTGHGSLRRPVGLLSAILVAAACADQAASQPRDCAAPRALANADGRDFADLRLRMNAQTGVSIGVDAAGGNWLTAHACDIEAGDGEASVTCEWNFPNHAAAAAIHDAVLERLRRCLPSGFPRRTESSTVPNWRTMRSNAGEFRRDGVETDVTLALIEISTPTPSAPDRILVGHHVFLTVLGSFEEREDDEEVDEEEGEED